jgi:Domain of unknown function (DUF4349)
MRIIPFPGRGEAGVEAAWRAELDELERSLAGDGEGSVADSWRELRADVRALAPPMAPEFEHELAAQIAERDATRRPGKPAAPARPGANAVAPEITSAGLGNRGHGGSSSGRRGSLLGWLGRSRRWRVAAPIAIAVMVAAAVVVGSEQSGTQREAAPQPRATAASSGAFQDRLRPANGAAKAPAAVAIAPQAGNAASTPGRVQQLAASLSLTAAPTDVQQTADRVARLAVSDGGFVQNSHVQVQQAGTSEANLTLKLPSAKLDAALASLGQLAPVRAESQSLQDITDAYDAARRRLADVTAERGALLRALSAATTQGQIDSLREQLAQSSTAIAQARSALQAVSQRASTAEVEVTVVGDAHAGSEGLTIHRGLHDAGRVVVVTVVVLLVAVSILVPLALLLVAFAAGRRAWRRYERERVLGVS